MNNNDNAELKALRSQCSMLMKRNAVLQAYVDRQGENVVNTITEGIHDAPSASDAAQSYDDAWFRALPFSNAIVRRIAQRLLSSLQQYPFIDVRHVEVHAAVSGPQA